MDKIKNQFKMLARVSLLSLLLGLLPKYSLAADSYTSNVGLRLIEVGSEDTALDWGEKLNDNFEIADSSFAKKGVDTSSVTADAPILGVGTGGNHLRLDTSSVTLLGPRIDTTEVASNTFNDGDMAPGTFTGIVVLSSNVSAGSLGSSVIASSIAQASVGGQQIGNSVIVSSHIQNSSVSGGDISSNTITDSNILAGTFTGPVILSSNIASGAVESTLTFKSSVTFRMGDNNVTHLHALGQNGTQFRWSLGSQDTNSGVLQLHRNGGSAYANISDKTSSYIDTPLAVNIGQGDPFGTTVFTVGADTSLNSVVIISSANQSTELLSILHSGNTGIGSSSPATRLDVNGTIKSAGGYQVSTSTGVSASCSDNQAFVSAISSGGILVGGSCKSVTQNIGANVLVSSHMQAGTFNGVVVLSSNVEAGSLGASVIASSVAVNAVLGDQIKSSVLTSTHILSGQINAWTIGLKDSMVLVSSTTVGTSSATTISITGLDSNTDGGYVYVLRIQAGAANPDVQLFINGDTTATNYWRQNVYGNESTAATDEANNPNMCPSATSQGALCWGLVTRNGFGTPMSVGLMQYNAATSIVAGLRYTQKTATVTNITQISFTSTAANGLGTNTQLLLYRLK